MYTKEEHMGAFSLRLGSRIRGKVGINEDGTVTAVSGEWFVDTGAFCDMSQAQVAVGCGEAQLMLRCANWNLQTKLVLTNRCASGSAVIAAAEDARKKLLEMASAALQVPADALDTRDGKVYVEGNPETAIPCNKVTGIMQTCTGFGRFKPDYSVPNFLVFFVEVEVDTDTGSLELRRVVAATDAGQVIDPPSLEGQMHGSLGAAGTDTAIFEETVLNRKTGHLLNINMIDYKWRTFSDLPEFRNVILETGLPTHRYEAVGVGEAERFLWKPFSRLWAMPWRKENW
jgi:CO/xanthine dehydrogenase Mo-binding subunit